MNETTDASDPGVDRQIPDWPMSYRIRRAMDIGDLNVDELADAIGVSPVTIYNYVKGATRPRRAALTILAGMSGLPLWWLEGADSPPPSDDVPMLKDRRSRRSRTQAISGRTEGMHSSRCIHAPSLAA